MNSWVIVRVISKSVDLILCLTILFSCFGCQELYRQNRRSIHVSPLGSDEFRGSKRKPIASIGRAVELAKLLKIKRPHVK